MKKKELYFLPIDDLTIQFGPEVPAFLKDTNSKEQNAFATLLQKAQADPRSCLDEVATLSKRYPASAEVDNLLIFVLLQTKKLKRPDRCIQEHFTRHPNYFFARINYADLLLRKRNIKKFLDIFPSENISHYFPDTKIIHACQYRSFMILMSHFYLLKKNQEKAKFFYEKAYRIDPEHPTILYLEKILYHKPFLTRVVTKIQSYISRFFNTK